MGNGITKQHANLGAIGKEEDTGTDISSLCRHGSQPFVATPEQRDWLKGQMEKNCRSSAVAMTDDTGSEWEAEWKARSGSLEWEAQWKARCHTPSSPSASLSCLRPDAYRTAELVRHDFG